MFKKIIFLISICLIICSCATDKALDTEPETYAPIIAESDTTIEETDDLIVEEHDIFIDEPELISVPEESEPYFTDTEVQEEYLRSISNLSGDALETISPQVFEDDKNQIFEIIQDLDSIMKKKDYNRWIYYLTPESNEYWSNRHNLQELSMYMYTGSDFRLNNIREYFEYFFIPARKGRQVDEIRYVTPEYVKVVQYKNNTDVIYYFFEKIDGEWKLWLDTL